MVQYFSYQSVTLAVTEVKKVTASKAKKFDSGSYLLIHIILHNKEHLLIR